MSTSVFPDSDVVTKKCQDWEYWFKQGWIEVATPMAYYENANTVTQKIAAMIAKLDNISYNYGGIAPYFMGLNPYEEVVQAVAALNGGSFGTGSSSIPRPFSTVPKRWNIFRTASTATAPFCRTRA